MKVNGQLKNAQLEVVTGSTAPGTKGLVKFDTECESVTVDNGQSVERLLDGRDLPVGVIQMWMVDTPPPGGRWLIMDGSSISTVQYPDLYAVLGGTYGENTTNNTFRLPDMRGQFVRGVSPLNGKDPGPRGTRGDGQGGVGVVGTTQNDQIPTHTHQYEDTIVTYVLNKQIVNVDIGSEDRDVLNDENTNIVGTTTTFTKTTNPSGTGNEVRPCNIAAYYIIKVK